ncbi:hypothetical protein V4R08_17830 (plasmid) [Nitrobacter sp. NHB1]|uniref:hypothetical protein n=1 Tax=Nitrobacter sp. NHB1 TaxID=3119830 RepID=UPI002FFDC2A6
MKWRPVLLGVQCVAGLAAVVLGILAICGIYTDILTLVALLVLGATVVLTGSTLSGTLMSSAKPTAGSKAETRLSRQAWPNDKSEEAVVTCDPDPSNLLQSGGVHIRGPYTSTYESDPFSDAKRAALGFDTQKVDHHFQRSVCTNPTPNSTLPQSQRFRVADHPAMSGPHDAIRRTKVSLSQPHLAGG